MKKVLLALVLAPLLLTAIDGQVQACTLWAATGGWTQDRGTLVGKNRDRSPEQVQELRFEAPPGGLRFLVLHPRGDQPRDIAGINEKGLVVVTAAASCIPLRERSRAFYLEGFLDRLLTSCATVEAVINKRTWFTAPAFYLVADRFKIALIEVGLQERRAIQVTDHELLCHTNHYLDKNLLDGNRQFNLGSYIRLTQIQYLLKSQRRPFTFRDFIRMSQDCRDGPDWSIWRAGSAAGKVHTLATWVVSLPPDGPPLLYVKTANPGEPPQARLIKLTPVFWAEGFKGNSGVISTRSKGTESESAEPHCF
jgi:isopenicillin-N N-acyltransferase-like protein